MGRAQSPHEDMPPSPNLSGYRAMRSAVGDGGNKVGGVGDLLQGTKPNTMSAAVTFTDDWS